MSSRHSSERTDREKQKSQVLQRHFLFHALVALRCKHCGWNKNRYLFTLRSASAPSTSKKEKHCCKTENLICRFSLSFYFKDNPLQRSRFVNKDF